MSMVGRPNWSGVLHSSPVALYRRVVHLWQASMSRSTSPGPGPKLRPAFHHLHYAAAAFLQVALCQRIVSAVLVLSMTTSHCRSSLRLREHSGTAAHSLLVCVLSG